MNYQKWSQDMLVSQVSQEELNRALAQLGQQMTHHKSEYEEEKMLKFFCEPIQNLERALLYKEKIHPSQFKLEYTDFYQGDYFIKSNRVENIVKHEIKLQLNRFLMLFGNETHCTTEDFEDTILDENIRSKVNKQIQQLLDLHFKEAADETKQAFKEFYALPIKYLEDSLLYHYNIHPLQQPDKESANYFEKQEKAHQILLSELTRYKRFVNIIL